MKNLIYLPIIIILISTACKKEDPPTPTSNNTVTTPPPTQQTQSDYWGCWREGTGKIGHHDMILIEQTTKPHTIQVADQCVHISTIPALDIGVFRNDTLILDNGIFEFWCYIVGDTLIYGVYAPGTETDKFIKI